MQLVDDAMRRERLLVLVPQRTDQTEPGPDDLQRIGTAGIVHQLVRAPDGTLRVVIQGLERVRLLDFVSTEPYMVARVELAPDQSTPGVEIAALRRAAVDLFRRLVAVSPELPDELAVSVEALPDPRHVVYLVASAVPLPGETRRELLELDPLDTKLRRLIDLLQHEVSVRELGQKITAETHQRISKAQRDVFLREQLRSIQRELGESEDNPDLAELRRQLEEAHLPEEARREAQRELDRLATIPPASPEYGMIRTYLDWTVSLPWNTLSGGDIDVGRARQVLDEDHYDLTKIKDRILEHLAVKKLRQERSATSSVEASREPILCFVGPPGVGKTSLGQSIARAMKRKFVRVSLGGVHDEAEIRGHRRTYVGSLPGNIIQAIRKAGARDCVMMLDEIDKMAASFQGDPSAAMLEVLDPEQNSTFRDAYLGIPFDLSSVIFIATANVLDTVAGPLRDRMEIISLAGYSDEEKLQIAKRYLLPRQRIANGLGEKPVTIDDEALKLIIRAYTREAGVRNLEREIGRALRHVAVDLAEGKAAPETLVAPEVENILGPARFEDEVAMRTSVPGVATGLAWTPVGGDILFIEAARSPGRGGLLLTGQLGEVMRESVQAAFTLVKGRADELGIDHGIIPKTDIHVHVPAGATPKDGPSAGVAMYVALVSLLTGRTVRSDTAMTGEISLRGLVLPVGGIKEKVTAAARAGLKRVMLPARNKRDYEDIPKSVRDNLEFIWLERVDQAIEAALDPAPATDKPKRARATAPAASASSDTQ
jgi:ATP-dependent Lon protease